MPTEPFRVLGCSTDARAPGVVLLSSCYLNSILELASPETIASANPAPLNSYYRHPLERQDSHPQAAHHLSLFTLVYNHQIIDKMSAAVSLNVSENLGAIQRLYDAFARGDGPGALAEMHERIEWNEAENFIYSDRNPYQSPSDVATGVFGRLLADWEDYEATPYEFFDAGDAIIALGRSKGINRATKKPLDAQFSHVWRLKDGKIIGFQQFIDTLQVHRATLSA